MKKSKEKMLLFFLIVTVFFFSCSAVSAQYKNQEKIPSYEQTDDFPTYLKQIIGFSFAAIGILALFMIVIGAYQYLMAAGNIGKVDAARETIGSAILGLVLGLCAWLIVYVINPDLVKMDLSGIQRLNIGTTGTSAIPRTYEPVVVTGTTRERIAQYDSIIRAASQKYGVAENIIKAMIDQESSGNPYAVSPKGATGLMQLMPDTASDLGVTDSRDPSQNIMAGTKFISQMYRQYGDGSWEKALAAYNWGSRNLQNEGMDNMPTETRKYILEVIGKAQSYS